MISLVGVFDGFGFAQLDETLSFLSVGIFVDRLLTNNQIEELEPPNAALSTVRGPPTPLLGGGRFLRCLSAVEVAIRSVLQYAPAHRLRWMTIIGMVGKRWPVSTLLQRHSRLGRFCLVGDCPVLSPASTHCSSSLRDRSLRQMAHALWSRSSRSRIST